MYLVGIMVAPLDEQLLLTTKVCLLVLSQMTRDGTKAEQFEQQQAAR